LTPGQPTAVSFRTSDVYHAFLPGHRIMVQIQSTWFPLADRNPQRFENSNQTKASDFQKATERVSHTSAMPSQVKVRTLPRPEDTRQGSHHFSGVVRRASISRSMPATIASTTRCPFSRVASVASPYTPLAE
jgi:hypothetical protein